MAFLMAGCFSDYESLELPAIINFSAERIKVDGFRLEAQSSYNHASFVDAEGGFIITKEDFIEHPEIVQGKYPETDTLVSAPINVDGTFSITIEGLETNYTTYAIKAFLTVTEPGTENERKIYSQETLYQQAGNIFTYSNGILLNDTTFIAFISIIGLTETDDYAQYGHCWAFASDSTSAGTLSYEAIPDNNCSEYGPGAGEAINFADTISIPAGSELLFIRPYLQFRDNFLYGEVEQFAISKGDYWEELGPWPAGQGPGLLAYATAFILGNKGYVVTGKKYLHADNNSLFTASRECWQFNPEDNTWARMPNLPGPARCYAGSFVIGDKAYVGGGWNGRDTVYRDYYEFSPSSGWRRVGDMVNYIYAPSTFVIEDKAYIATGRRCDPGIEILPEGEDCVFTGRLYQFDPEDGQWIRLDDEGIGDEFIVFLPVTFMHHSTAYLGTGIKSHFHRDFHTFTPQNGWTHNTTFLPGSARWGAFSFTINNKHYVGGGAHYCEEFFFFGSWNGCGGFQDVWRFDPYNSVSPWEEVANSEKTRRFGAAAFSVNEKGYVYGGIEAIQSMKIQNTMLLYHPQEN